MNAFPKNTDADIFVMRETYQNESLVLPSRSLFHWKSSRVGDDVVEVREANDYEKRCACSPFF